MIKEMMKEMLLEEFMGKPNVAAECQTTSPYVLGKSYHVRTVTMAIAGKLKAIYENELVFEKASWVADTGRFNEYLVDTTKVSENEPFKNDVIIGRGALIDCTEIDGAYDSVK